MADDTNLPWEVSFEEAPGGKFTKRNPRMYRALIAQLSQTVNPANGKSQIATVTVMTGDMTTIDRKARGKDEHLDEMSFRDAGKERGFGLRIDATHRADGKTDLRIQIQPKKEFSPEAIESRKQKLALARAKKASEKAAMDQATKQEAEAVNKLKAQAPTAKPKA